MKINEFTVLSNVCYGVRNHFVESNSVNQTASLLNFLNYDLLVGSFS